jgi:hypothetical protein
MVRCAGIDTRLRYMACQIDREDGSACFLAPGRDIHESKPPFVPTARDLRPKIDTAVLLTPVTLRISMGREPGQMAGLDTPRLGRRPRPGERKSNRYDSR